MSRRSNLYRMNSVQNYSFFKKSESGKIGPLYPTLRLFTMQNFINTLPKSILYLNTLRSTHSFCPKMKMCWQAITLVHRKPQIFISQAESIGTSPKTLDLSAWLVEAFSRTLAQVGSIQFMLKHRGLPPPPLDQITLLLLILYHKISPYFFESSEILWLNRYFELANRPHLFDI